MSRDIKAGGAYVELLLKSQSFVAGLKSASSRLRSFGDSAKRIGSLGFLGGGGGGGLAKLFAGAGAAAALAYPIKLAAQLEVAEAQFTALTGSADKAREMLSQLEQFAPKSLLPVEELQRASQMLLSYGIAVDSVVPAVQGLAAVSRGNAERFGLLALALGQVTSKTRLYSAEVRQFVESGWSPLLQIMQATGETYPQVTKRLEAGGIAANEVTAALLAATGATGRFGSLLAAMGKTAQGSFSQLLTGIKIAIRPLGQELLPSIKGVLTSAREWLPAFSKIVKENAGFAVSIGTAVVAVATGASALISFGVAAKIAAFGLSGIAGALGLLLNPITLIAGAVGGLGYLFFTATEVGRTMASSLANWFGQLRDIAVEAFGGIADALAAGDLALAGKVAWLGLKAAWLEGTHSLQEIWASFKQVFMQTTIDVVFDALEYWERFTAGVEEMFIRLKNGAMDVGLDVGAWLNKIGKSDEEKASIDRITEMAKKGFAATSGVDLKAAEEEKKAALAAIEAARKTAQESQKSGFFVEMDKLDKDLAAAKAELAQARADAAKARAGGMGLDGAPAFDPANFNMNAASLKNDIFGSFSGAALAAQGGAGGKAEDKIIAQLKKDAGDQKKQLDKIIQGGAIGP